MKRIHFLSPAAAALARAGGLRPKDVRRPEAKGEEPDRPSRQRRKKRRKLSSGIEKAKPKVDEFIDKTKEAAKEPSRS
jgi:hypothetical protein